MRITRSGLLGMAVSVSALWGCLISERVITHHANVERVRALYRLEQLRGGHPQPVSVPRLYLPHRPIVLG